MNYLLILLIYFNISHALELKSYKKVPKSKRAKAVNVVCDLTGSTKNQKRIFFKQEKFNTLDLQKEHTANLTGIYINFFDYLGFNLFLDKDKKYQFDIETEETSKHIKKSFTRLPAQIAVKTGLVKQEKNKRVAIDELKINCYH